MIFIMYINDSVDGGSQTAYQISTGSGNPRTNKRKLQKFLAAIDIPVNKTKQTLKAMNFWSPEEVGNGTRR